MYGRGCSGARPISVSEGREVSDSSWGLGKAFTPAGWWRWRFENLSASGVHTPSCRGRTGFSRRELLEEAPTYWKKSLDLRTAKQDGPADHIRFNSPNTKTQRGKETCPRPHSKFKAQLELEFTPPAACSDWPGLQLLVYISVSQPGQGPSRAKGPSHA